MNVNIKRLHADAVIPQYARAGDAGFDLVAVEDVIIRPGETAKVPVGLAFEIPQGYEMQIRPRSGVSLKTRLRVVLGTVDAGFRGEVAVIVDNVAPTYKKLMSHVSYYYRIDGSKESTSIKVQYDSDNRCGGRVAHQINESVRDETYLIRKGDRIAQGVISPVTRATFSEVDELGESERGAGGFGSTGTSVAEVGA